MIRFKIYGAGDLESLGDKIVGWMKSYELSYEIEEIIDIDQILLDGIQSVPSVKILIEMDVEQRDYDGYDDFVVALMQLSRDISEGISRVGLKKKIARDQHG